MGEEGQGGWGRNWDALLREYSSEDSEELDVPNVMSFKKNMGKITTMVQDFIPHMAPGNFVHRPVSRGSPPTGMNQLFSVSNDVASEIKALSIEGREVEGNGEAGACAEANQQRQVQQRLERQVQQRLEREQEQQKEREQEQQKEREQEQQREREQEQDHLVDSESVEGSAVSSLEEAPKDESDGVCV